MRRIRNILKYAGYSVLTLAGAVALANVLAPVNTDVPYAQLVKDRNGQVMHAFLAGDGQWRMQAQPEEISPELRKAIIYKEDRFFYYHPGVNPVAVMRALALNIATGKRTSGASTITMQVVRLLEPRRRTYRNKVIELFRALQLELHYSKEEILRLYLDMVPYGSNIQGVKAASILYFNKMPDHLSLAELTALSIIPNRPGSLVPGRNNTAIIQQRNKWLLRFGKAGLFPAEAIRDALQEPFDAHRLPAPHEAPQLAWRLRAANAGNKDIQTSVDAGMQRQAEGIVSNYMHALQLGNIHNASVVVADNHTPQILAYIGSSDFGDREHAGQVDGVHALRSPGSTLKPLLYGLCMDKGLVTPHAVIADVPVNIKGYSPENYDREFRGNVTIEHALSHSLNIPAVKLLEANGLDNFLNTLTGAGFSSIAGSRKDMGMSVILGGCSVRLDELTALYCALANKGRYRPLSLYTGNEAGGTDTALLSPEASYMVSHILSQLQRPDLPNAWHSAKNVPHIAWKTGTSYGRRDAWSIGYNSRLTIGVWVGNFSAEGVQELSGIATATPLLFQLFNALDYAAEPDWLKAPATLNVRTVCAETGLVPDEFCTNQVPDYYIPGISTTRRCDHMKQMWLSPDEAMYYCSRCLPPEGYKTLLMPNVSPELATYFEAAHISYTHLPPHNPECSASFRGEAPVITSLTNGMTYLVENREQQQFQLSCLAAGDVHEVHWYINDQFYATAAAGAKLFFKATSPDMKISCADDKGRNTDIRIKVQFI